MEDQTPIQSIEPAIGLNSVTNIEINSDLFPTKINRNFQPTLEVNPFSNKPASIIAVGTSFGTSAVVYTTPQDIDFYLCTCTLAGNFTANFAGLNNVQATINGATINIVSQPFANTNLGSFSQVNDWSQHPVKIDRGTNITVFGGVVSAGYSLTATITGIVIDSNTFNVESSNLTGEQQIEYFG